MYVQRVKLQKLELQLIQKVALVQIVQLERLNQVQEILNRARHALLAYILHLPDSHLVLYV